MKLAVALTLLSGCDALFGLSPITLGSGSAVPDGAPGPDAKPVGDATQATPWACATPPSIPTWTGSNFSVVGTFSMLTHPTADVVAQRFYFATAGDIEECVLQANLRGADTCSVVSSLSSPSAETAPSLASDGMTMYFDRVSVAMQSTQSANGTWLNAAPMALPGQLATAEVGATSTATEHGMRMLLSDGADLYEASFAVQTGWIEVLHSLDNLNTVEFHEVDPYLSPDGCWTVFASDRNGTNYDLYFATRKANGTFDTPVALANINNTVTDDRGPFVANQQILYYTRGSNPEVAEPP